MPSGDLIKILPDANARQDGAVPVFPLLEILRHGGERRLPFVALERDPNALDNLEAELPEGTRVFIREERVHHACAACDAGEPHEEYVDAARDALSNL